MENSYIVKKAYIDEQDYQAINELQARCHAHNGCILKLELDYKIMCKNEEKSDRQAQDNEFFYYVGDRLVAYIGLCSFGFSTLEVSGMVDPKFRRKKIFTSLMKAVKDEWRQRDFEKILLLTDENSLSGQAFIRTLHARYVQTEYEMYYKDKKLNKTDHDLKLRKATNADVKAIAIQNYLYFSGALELDPVDEAKIDDHMKVAMPEEEEKKGFTTYLAEVHGTIVGKVNLQVTGALGGIFGLGVLPIQRKKGYGRQILMQAITLLKAHQCKDIMLQVSATNQSALNLYKACGFDVTSTMQYYEIIKKT